MSEVAAVGAIAVRDRQLLLVRRSRSPSRGRWSLPGGRVELGETDEHAVIREVLEETGLAVDIGEFVGEVLREGPGGVTYRIRDFRVTPLAGPAASGDQALVSGDDALEVAWVPYQDLSNYRLSARLLETLRSWGILE